MAEGNRLKKAVEDSLRSPDFMRDSVAVQAAMLVRGDRNKDYGDPCKMYGVVADLWSTLLNHKLGDEAEVTLTATDVLEMMTLMKIGREIVRHKKDNLVDISGYTELLAVVYGEAKL